MTSNIKKLVIRVLYQFNSMDTGSRAELYRHIRIYIDVYNAIFVNTKAKFNEITQLIEFVR